MPEHDDGGPAFPCSGNDKTYEPSGMSLRDYFAAHATDEDAQFAVINWMLDKSHKSCSNAMARYLHADQMLVARRAVVPNAD